MPRHVRVELKLDGLRSLTFEQGMSSMLYRKAQAVLSAAQRVSPIDTGTYARSFAIAFATTDRNVCRVHNRAPWALAVEYGGSSTKKARPLGRGIDAAAGTR